MCRTFFEYALHTTKTPDDKMKISFPVRSKVDVQYTIERLPPEPIAISKLLVQIPNIKVMVAVPNRPRSNTPSVARGKNTNGAMTPGMAATTM